MKTKLLVLLFTLFYNVSFAQETFVPDANFEAFLEANGMGNGIANDDYVTTANIENVTSLNVSSQNIIDMTGIEGFLDLQVLNINSNAVTSINLSANTELVEFYAISNSLVNLSLKENIKLERIDISDNDLISLDFRSGNNVIVKSFRAIANYQLYCVNVDDASALYLTSWNVDANTSFDENCGLTSITDTSFEAILENNNIGNGIIGDNYVYTVRIEETTTLDISNQNVTSIAGIELFQNLNVLNANSNDISTVDLSLNTALTELYLISNELTTLDLTTNTNLLKVNVNDNDLTTFDFRNGSNGIIQSFNAIANYNLKCITVDDASLSSLALWNIDSGTSFNEDCNWTYIPDDNFENYLETHDADGNVVPVGDATSMGNGKINDDYVITAKIKDVVRLDISGLSITDVTGIEGFLAVEDFNCYNNGISSIDISQNTALKVLNLNKNNLITLDVSNNTLLTELRVTKNSITSLNVSQNTALITLSCSRNQLNGLDVTKNTVLKNLYCYTNPIGSLDVTKNILLEDLDCVETNLTSLDVSKNPELESLQVYENSLTSLDISANVKLIELYAEYNQITSLDVSKNTVLEDLSCYSNQLTSLNIRNGNNTNLDSGDFDIRNNPGLTCVVIDDPTYANANFSKKDNQTIFKTFCNSTYVPDANFEAYLETHTDYGGVVAIGDPTSMGNGIANDDYVGTEKIQGIKNLNISNQGITDFTGLEGFESLEVLSTFGNTVSSLDLTANINLRELNCYSMGLSSINISGLTSIERLVLRENNLTSIDLSSNLKLNNLYISNNNLNSIDVSANTLLTDIRVRENLLNTLDVTNNINLTRLFCSDNSLSTINVANNTLLETLSCGGNQFASIDVSNLINLTDLFIENTPTLTSLEVSNNVKLEDIGVDNNTLLTTLNLSSNSKLIEVYINNTGINTLDFSSSTDLEYVECKNNNNLTFLNFKSGNTSSVDEMYATGNPNLVCIQVDDPTASYLNSWDKDNIASFAEYCQLTYVPNDNFEAILEGRGFGNGIANDNYVYTELIKNETTLIIQDNDIADLTGIEDFTALELLLIRRSNVVTADVSNNIKLTHLSLADNKLTTLDLSKNVLLEEVYIDNNTMLGTVDYAMLPKLTTLNLSNTGISTVDVSNNPLIRVLNLNDNNFTALDVSSYSTITQVRITNNKLTSLNVATGNNAGFTWFDASGNPDLACIQVDNINPNSSIWHKDATATYTLYCELTYIADANFENYLETHDADGNTVVVGNVLSMGNGIVNDNQVATSKIAQVTSLDISSQNISDLTGIEGFTALESLNVDYNDLTSLDLSSNTSLKILDAAENDFTLLDLSGYLALEEVELRSNSITDLIVENNPNLKKLRVGKNKLAILDVTACTQLEELVAHQNVLVSLDVRNGNNNLITKFFAIGNASLTCVEVDDAVAAYLATWEKDATANFSENCNSTVWLGTNDDNWNETNNWVGNTAPQTTSNVIIPYRINTPRLTSSEQVNDFRVAEYSSFDISENGSVTIDGDFSNSGTFTMTSTASNSASLLVEGTANGEITYKRGGLIANKWSIVSAPVSGQSIKDFVENAANNIRVNTTVSPNRYAIGYYDDSKAAGTKWVYYTVDDLASNTITFEKGRSYAISRATDGAVSFTGTIETEGVNKSIIASEWNAVGNPFTAFLPINENSGANFINDNLASFDPTYVGAYVWDNAQNKYAAKTLVSGESSLAPGQGFFVKTTTGISSIAFTEAQRKTQPVSGGVFSKAVGETIPTIELSIASKGIKVNTTISYSSTATKGLDVGYDVGNFDGASLDIYTKLLDGSSEKNFTYQSLPSTINETYSIPVGIKAKEGASVTISVKGLALEGMQVYLEDTKLGKFINLSKEAYKLTLTKSENGTGRFYLHTKVEGAIPTAALSAIKIYNVERKLFVEGILGAQFNIAMYTLLGSKVYSGEYQGESKNEINLPVVETGVYIIRIETTEGIKRKKIILKN